PKKTGRLDPTPAGPKGREAKTKAGRPKGRRANKREEQMQGRFSLGAAILAGAVALAAAAAAADAMHYPDWEGMWNRGSPVGSWDPTKPPGRGQQAPLTPAYQKVLEDNIARQK